jgi:hypothetical protein
VRPLVDHDLAPDWLAACVKSVGYRPGRSTRETKILPLTEGEDEEVGEEGVSVTGVEAVVRRSSRFDASNVPPGETSLGPMPMAVTQSEGQPDRTPTGTLHVAAEGFQRSSSVTQDEDVMRVGMPFVEEG